MPTENQRKPQGDTEESTREDEPIPAASEDEVLDETARLAREGRKELASDPKEQKQKPASE